MEAFQDWLDDLDMKNYNALRRRTHAFFEDPESSKAASIYNMAMTVAILVSVAIVLLETVPSPASNGVEYPEHYFDLSWSKHVYYWIEVLFTIIFTGELVLRFWAAPIRLYQVANLPPSLPPRSHGGGGRGGPGGRNMRGRDSVVGKLPGAELNRRADGGGKVAAGLPGMGGMSLGRSAPAGLPGMGGMSIGSLESSGIDGSIQMAEENRTMTTRRKTSFRSTRGTDSDEPFTSDFYNWLDLIAVLPFYVETIMLLTAQGNSETVDLSVIRTFRICRIFKIFRRFNDTEVLVITVKRVWRPLLLPFGFFILFSFLFGSIVWFLEPCYVRDSCNFPHIFSALYFCMVTMTTVGYGDQIPQRWHARFVTMVIMLFGSLFLSMPLSVIGSEFDAVYKEREKAKEDEKEVREKEEKKRADASAGVNSEEEDPNRNGLEKANETKPVNLTRFFLVDEYVKICETIGNVRGAIDSSSELTKLDQDGHLGLMKNLGRTVMNMYTLAMKLHRLAQCPKDELKKNTVRDDEYTKRAANRMKMAMKGLSGKGVGGTLDVLINSAKEMTTNDVAQGDDEHSAGEVEVKPERLAGLQFVFGILFALHMVFAKLRRFFWRCCNIRSSSDLREGLTDIRVEAKNLQIWLLERYINLHKFFSGEDIDFIQQVQDAKNSGKWRDQLWLGLEGLDQSTWSRTVQHVLMVCILLSTVVFAFQTDASYTVMGETSVKCQDLVEIYCGQWTDDQRYNKSPFSKSVNRDIPKVQVADPACFMWDGEESKFDRPLKFSSDCYKIDDNDADRDQCYGQGFNFGSVDSGDAVVETGNDGTERGHLTCDQWSSHSTYDDDNGDDAMSVFLFLPRPFRSQGSLPIYSWMEPTAEYSMNTIYDVCARPECYNGHDATDMRLAWIYLEATFAFFFTLEMIARLVSARSLALLVVDPYFVIDVASLLPFYIEVGTFLTAKDGRNLDFSIGPTDDTFMSVIKLLKVARIFKMTRQNPKVSILWETAVVSMQKLTIPFVFLFLMLISFGVVLYQIEGGVEFNVKDCDDPDRGPSWCSKRLTDDALSAASSAYESGHSRIKVDTMDGGIVSLPSAFEAIWLTIVTMTTVGYGGVSPITPLGKITAAIIMLFGSFYLSMPLTIVGSVFYQCYKKQEEAERQMMASIIQAAQEGESKGDDIKLTQDQAELLTKYKEQTTALERVLTRLKRGETKLIGESTSATTEEDAAEESKTSTKGRMVFTSDRIWGSIDCSSLDMDRKFVEELIQNFDSVEKVHTELVSVVLEVDSELLRLQQEYGVGGI